MPVWLLGLLQKVVAPFIVSKVIDYAKEELLDREVDEAIARLSEVAQKLHLISEQEAPDSPVGHIDDETKQKALEVVESALSIADMIGKVL